MKKALSVLLAVLLLVACVPTAIIGSATTESIWSKRVALSEGATLSEADCSLTAGMTATFKVTLPAGGYAQFMQKLDLIKSEPTQTERVNIVVGDGTKAAYSTSDLYVQLTSSADTSKDIVPVDEPNGADPGTDGMTWHLYGPHNVNSSSYAVNNGSSLVSGAQFTNFGLIESHTLAALFVEDTDGTVKVYNKNYKASASLYASGVTPSTKTVSAVGLDDGVYVRIRNGEDKAQTYTVTIDSADISAGYRDGEFVLSDTASTLDSVDYAVANGIGTVKYTATLSGKGSYIQFDKKLTSLIGSDEKYYVNVKISDFASANFWTQLTDDATAASDFAPKKEQNNADPGTDAMTWWFYGYNSNVIIGKGLDSGGYGSAVASASSLSNSGLSIYFKNNSGYVGIKTGNIDSAPDKGYEKYTSTRTMADTGLTDGAYFRVRNGISGAVTYTITVSFDATAYTDGVYKFSDEGSGLISYNRELYSGTVAYGAGKVAETATVKLSGNGGYVQLDRKLSDLINGGALVNVKVDDGEIDDYLAANFYVQLTADKAALTDVVPQKEYDMSVSNIDDTAITYGLITASGALRLCNGNDTRGCSIYANHSRINANGDCTTKGFGGVAMKFVKNDTTGIVAASTIYNDLVNAAVSGKRESKLTAAAVGIDNGGYIRIRNGQTTSQTYTITVYYNNVFANTTQNGTVTLDKVSALTGDTVKATVTANKDYQLKAGSLKYTVDGSKYYPITARVGEDESVSNVFAFAMPEDAVNVTAEFVAADAANHALLGAAYNIENGEAGKDMRFGSRAYRKAGDSELISCGNYLLRADSTLGAALADGVELTEQQLAELINPSEGQFVKRVPTSVLNDRCDDYVDYTVRIVGVADGYADFAYVCVSYANYRDAEGNVETVYSAPCIRSYNQLINAAQ